MNPLGPELQSIFDEALEHPAGPERSAYLDRACGGDPGLRFQVEALLTMVVDDEEDGSLGTATGTETQAVLEQKANPEPELGRAAGARWSAIAETLGTTIGPYRLLGKIGEGGMGTVFLAEQEKPIRRQVALKVIKPGMDTAQVIARFEAERQALAIMDHPNIARVLDVGATDTGRPFFVMELVRGVPITEHCDRNHLSPKERLKLFLSVCGAIQHAHQKGIIHRAIKPSNVLVTLIDEVPEPKVIDFGVAKAIEQRLTERTIFTELGKVVGTLEYMSPEQADLNSVDIDTRSDIYSLGVLLYELLTGSTPLERTKLRWVAHSEILRLVREEEPPKPSTRLAESKQTPPSISALRKMEPGRLSKLLRGDLDWIVMKSLEKDRTRRYESATGFARDIQRYLDGDAVEASPPSASYKLRKFARKHRVALATVGSFALLLVAATAISVSLAVRADRERDRANDERSRAVSAEQSAREHEGLAQKAATSAQEQQTRAQDRERIAIDTVKRYVDVIRDTPELKNNPTLGSLRARLMKQPQEFFKRLRDQLQKDRDTTADSLDRLAMSSYELGQLSAEIGDKQDALRAFEESRVLRERLVREHPTSADYQRNLAAALGSLGNLQMATGHPAESLLAYEQSRLIQERLVRDHPTVARYQLELAATLDNTGNHQVDTGRRAEALKSYEQARAIREQLVREDPSNPRYQSELSGTDNNLGLLLMDLGRTDEALATYEQARTIRERLVRDHPTVPLYQRELAGTYTNIGNLQMATFHPVEAMASSERARGIEERLVAEYPSVCEYRLHLASTYFDIGRWHDLGGRRPEALASYQQARTMMERLATEHPESPDNACNLGGTLNDIAVIEFADGQADNAWADIAKAVELQRKAFTANPSNPKYRTRLTSHLGNQLRMAEKLAHPAEADQSRRELAEMDKTDPARIALETRFNEMIRGGPAKNTGERLTLAELAYKRERYAVSVRLYTEAFASNPKIVDNRRTQHPYNLACAASLAGSGLGKDEPPNDPAAQAQFRRQALDWLRYDLNVWSKVFDSGSADDKAKIAPTLGHWKEDTDLAGIRDEKGLAKLPEAERAEARQLWSDVEQLRARAPRTQ